MQRFFGSVWNYFDLSVVPEVLSPNLIFRGSLSAEPGDIEYFKSYVKEIEAAFPDFYQRMDAIYADGDVVIAKMSWSGTHTGNFRGVAPTGKRFMYPGIFVGRMEDDRFVEIWAMGDSWNMWRVIGEGGKEIIEEEVWARRRVGGRENEWSLNE